MTKEKFPQAPTDKNGVIQLVKLLKHLNNNTDSAWTKSVPTPNAQSTTLCGNATHIVNMFNLVQRVIDTRSKEAILHKAVIELMFINGIRISEVLDISGNNITSTGNIRIKGKKGSQDRIVVPGLYRDFWISKKGSSEKIGDVYSRFYFYRLFKKLGFNINEFGQKKESVTHSLRHLFIKSSNQDGQDIETIQRFIGHKSIKSTEYYANKRTK